MSFYSEWLIQLILKLKCVESTLLERLSNSYTMACPLVCGDNPQALASGFSYVQVDKHGIIILTTTSV